MHRAEREPEMVHFAKAHCTLPGFPPIADTDLSAQPRSRAAMIFSSATPIGLAKTLSYTGPFVPYPADGFAENS